MGVRRIVNVDDVAEVEPFVALTVKENEPAAEGVPLRTPPVESESPVGRLPLATLNVIGVGEPEATNVYE